MSTGHLNHVEQVVARYERRDLEHLPSPPLADAVTLLDGHEFVRIRGVASFWRGEEHTSLVQRVTDLVTSSHTYGSYLTFVLTGTPHQVRLYFALGDAGIGRSLLQSVYPGIDVDKRSVRNLGTQLKGRFLHTGMISGIPSRGKVGLAEESAGLQELEYLERVIRGMRKATWVYVVQAYPRSRNQVLSARQALLTEITTIASLSRQQVQHSTQASRARTSQVSETVSEARSGEFVNRAADYAVDQLEVQVQHLEAALALGLWQVAVYYGASQESDAGRLAALLVGALSGPESRPEPIRAHPGQTHTSGTANQFNTYLSSERVSHLVQLPTQEVPGFVVTDYVDFDVDFDGHADSQISVGEVLWEGSPSGAGYAIALDHLSRHGAVFGVTGSGKTTTLLNLLYQLWRHHNQPFLVIEPAKTEYRALLGKCDQDGLATGPIPDLCVYTLGDEESAPFRLNPFEFETTDSRPRSPVLSHIDFLKAVFNAAFILYAPMPYVLETALHEIYEDKGWNLATGENVRLSEAEWSARHRYPIFPTLTDLYQKVEAVTTRLGYEARIEQDVIAGLKARLGSLRLGSKGLMLDTPRGIPLSELTSRPVILELEGIGNDDEKTFLMGLVLARLYSYRRLQSAEGRLQAGLQHVLVIEEAHRLLKHISTSVDTEAANLRAQAVESFVNILSEVRHYGQGVLVAEQIPSKLTPDAIKNTNLKLIHRLSARDDRELLGTTMNMSEAQIRHMAVLNPGKAIAYAGGDDHPYLLDIEDFKKRKGLRQVSNRSLSSVASRYISLSRYLPVPEFQSYGVLAAEFGRPNTLVYQAALRHMARPEIQRTWATIIARTNWARNSLPDAVNKLRRLVATSPGHLIISQQGEALLMLIVLGVAQALQERGAENGWAYPLTDSMRDLLTEGLSAFVRTGELHSAASTLDRFVRTYENNMIRSLGAYPGCEICRSVCLYRSEASRLLTAVDQGHIRSVLASASFQRRREDYEVLAGVLRGIVKQWLGGESSEIDDLAYCAALVSLPSIGFDEYEQAQVAHELGEVLL